AETSQLLARVTAHAAVVIPPTSEVERVRSVQLVALQPDVLLCVVILSDGAIAREAFRLDHVVAESDVAAAAARLHDAWSNATLAALPDIASTGRVEVDAVIVAADHTMRA